MNMDHAIKETVISMELSKDFSSYTEVRLAKPIMRKKYRMMQKNKAEKTMLERGGTSWPRLDPR